MALIYNMLHALPKLFNAKVSNFKRMVIFSYKREYLSLNQKGKTYPNNGTFLGLWMDFAGEVIWLH